MSTACLQSEVLRRFVGRAVVGRTRAVRNFGLPRVRPVLACLRAAIVGSLMEEFTFEQDLVRALLRDQQSDLAHLEVRDVNGGWDNQQWRLGEELAVRLPRTKHAPALLHTEQTWLHIADGAAGGFLRATHAVRH